MKQDEFIKLEGSYKEQYCLKYLVTIKIRQSTIKIRQSRQGKPSFPHAWPFLIRKRSCIPHHLSNGPNDLKLGGLTKNILLVQAPEEFFS